MHISAEVLGLFRYWSRQMRISFPTALSLFHNMFETKETGYQPGEFLQELLQFIADKATSHRKPIGPTHPLRGEYTYLKDLNSAKYSKTIQFPSDEKLPDGRHRYFIKDGELIDRK